MKSTIFRIASILIAVLAVMFVLSTASAVQAQTITSLATGNWNSVDTWVAISRTGTITSSTASSTVTGTGTLFLSEIAVGDRILRNDGTTSIGIVQSIASNTSLTLTANASNNNTNVTYTARKIPGAGNDVVHNIAVTVTIPSGYAAAANSITFGSSANGIVPVITFTDGTSSLTTTADVIISAPAAGATRDFTVGPGTLSVGGDLRLSVGASGDQANRISKLSASTGTVNISSDLIFNDANRAAPNVLSNQLTMSGAATVNLSGNFTINGTTPAGTLTPGTTSTFNFNGSAAGQTIPIGVSSVIYNNLTTNNTNASGATLSAAITTGNVTGNLTVNTGTLNNGGFLIVGNAGKTFTVANGATFNLSGTSAFPTGFGTVTLGATSTTNYNGTGAQTVAAQTYGHLTISGARTTNTVTLVSGTITVKGNWTNNATFTSGSIVVTGNTASFTGTGTQTIGGTATTTPFNLVVVNQSSSSDIVEANSVITIASGGLTLTQGTFKLSSGSTITPFSGASSIAAPAGLTVNNASAVVNYGSSGSLTVLGSLTVNSGSMTVGSASGNALLINASTSNVTVGGGTLSVAGRVQSVSSGTLTVSGGTLSVPTVGLSNASNASFEMGATGNFTFTSGAVVLQQANGGAGGDLVVASGAGTKSITGGTFQIGNAATGASQVLKINSAIAIFNLTINATNSPTGRLDTNNLTLSNNVTISGGTLDAATNNKNITVGGNWSNSGTFSAGTATVTFNSTVAVKTIAGTLTGTSKFNKLTFNGIGGAWSFSNPADVGSDFTITVGIVTAPSGNLNVGGNWSNGGTFTHNSGTVTFNGAANQSIGGNSTTFGTLTISNTGSSPTNVVSLATNTTVSTALNVTTGVFSQGASASDDFSLTMPNSPAVPVTISAGATWQNLGKGDVTLSGNVSNSGTINFNSNGTPCGGADDIVIASSTGGSQRTWSGTGTFSMTDVTVSDQRSGTPNPPVVILVNDGTNAGNNVGWVFVNQCTAGTYTWIGGTVGLNTNWTVSTNWSPTRVSPAATDILFFDGNSTPAPTVTNVPTETNAALRLINNVNGVTLNAATGVTSTLTLNGGTGTAFSVPSGTLLTLNGPDPLQISVSSGSTGTVGGQIILQGGAHRILGSVANPINFQSGSFFTTSTNFAGNPFGTSPNASVSFASGSNAFFNAGNDPFGGAANSVVTFNLGSIQTFNASSAFSSSGRTYGFLNLDGSQTYSGSGTSQMTIFNDLTIVTGSTLTLSGSAGGNLNMFGNFTNNGTFNANSRTTTFGGTSAQTISGSGTVAFAGLTISNVGAGTTTVNKDASVSGVLTLTTDLTIADGIILTQSGTSDAAATGDAVGDVKRTDVGGTPKSFGNVNVQITNGGSATVDVTLAKNAPGGFAGAVLRNYTIEPLTGTGSGATVRLHYIDTPTTELNGNAEGSLTLWRAVGSPHATWTDQGFTSRNTSVTNLHYVEKTSVAGFSTWAIADGSVGHAPTLVRLTGFTATTQDDGVMLEWKSGFEAHNLGYHVYRYQDGQRTRVTPSLIAGSSLISKHGRDLSSGYSYGWFDPQGTVGTQYELQAIDLHGDIQTFTPGYTAKQGAHGNSQKARAALVTEVAANAPTTAAQNGWAKGMNTAAAKPTAQASVSALTTQQTIAGQQAVKIRVNQNGWYRITQPQLLANGLSASGDARKLQLFVDGVEVPIRLSTDKATLGSGDTLEFYGTGLDNLNTDTHTYYLVSGARNGLRIPTTADKGPGKAKNEILAPDFLYTVERKDRFDYLPGLLNGDDGNIFGELVSSDPLDQTMTLQNIDTTSTAPAQLEVILQGFTELNHQVQVQLNGSYVGTINFSGATHKSSTLPVNSALLKEGANTVTLTAAGGDVDYSFVDALRMTYAHSYRADNDSLSFSVGNRAAFVTGFSSAAIRVIDVTNPGAVQELTPKITQSNGSYGFTLQAGSTVQNLVAFVDNQARQPASMVKNQPSTLNASTNAADLVIVTHGEFRSSADTLAAARRAQGMKVSVVDVEDVYDEFSFGAHAPQALKDFFSWSNTHWATGPKYALLFGDSSWDPRNFMEQGFSDYVPTKLVDTVEFETASDDWLADFNGDGIPEIAIGRLPVRTTSDANTMVSKILNYDQERNGGAALRGALLVSDGGFEDQTAQVQSYLSPITTVQTLNRSAIGNDDSMRTQIVNAIDAGPAIVNYFGHGSVGVWTGAGLLNQDNAATLNNGNRVTLFVMMTCLNGYSHDAFIDSLAETLLRDPQGGAFAVWASSGATEPVGQAQMNTQLYQSLLGNQPMTLGDAVRQAKLSTSDFDVRRTWILLGDPTMRLK